MVCKAIYWATSTLYQSFLEIKDIPRNVQAFFHRSDLQEIMTPSQCLRFEIYDRSNRSKLFIFRDYTLPMQHVHDSLGFFVGCRVQILPTKEDPDSLGASLVKESIIRVAKGTTGLVLGILSLPVWVPLMLRTYAYYPKATVHAIDAGCTAGIQHTYGVFLPLEPEHSHFNAQDILRIGNALVGYRHVSTEDLALSNAQKGIPDGCSLNISFCGADSYTYEAKFKNLDLMVASGDDCESVILQYEHAITDFIEQSIEMDFENFPKTYEELLSTIDRTRFMIVKTKNVAMRDAWKFGGLGRFPKETVSPEGIFLLPRLLRESLGISQNKIFDDCDYRDYKALVHHLAVHYRLELLRYLREDFNPDLFNKFYRY